MYYACTDNEFFSLLQILLNAGQVPATASVSKTQRTPGNTTASFFHPEILRDHNVVSSGSFWVLCVLSYWKNLFITLKQNEKICPLENCVLVIFLVLVRKYLMRSNLRKEGFSSQSEGAILHDNRSLRQLITLHPPMRSRERIMPMLSYRSPLHSVQDHRSWDSAAHIQDGSSNLN